MNFLNPNNTTTPYAALVPETAKFNGEKLSFDEILKRMKDDMKELERMFPPLKDRDIHKAK